MDALSHTLNQTYELVKQLQAKLPNATYEQLLILAEIKLNISKMQFQEKPKEAS